MPSYVLKSPDKRILPQDANVFQPASVPSDAVAQNSLAGDESTVC